MSTSDDAAIEQDAAGPPVASTWRVLSLLGRCRRMLQARARRAELRATLCDLTDRELTDIGLTRAEADYIGTRRTIDNYRVDATCFWMMSRM